MKKIKVNKPARKVDIQKKKSTKIYTINNFEKNKIHGKIIYTINSWPSQAFTRKEAIALCAVNNYTKSKSLTTLISYSLFTQIITDIQKIKKSLKIK